MKAILMMIFSRGKENLPFKNQKWCMKDILKMVQFRVEELSAARHFFIRDHFQTVKWMG
jgi:hypothetical protein